MMKHSCSLKGTKNDTWKYKPQTWRRYLQMHITLIEEGSIFYKEILQMYKQNMDKLTKYLLR